MRRADDRVWIGGLCDGDIVSHKQKSLNQYGPGFSYLIIKYYLFEPVLIMAQRKPIVAVAESCFM